MAKSISDYASSYCSYDGNDHRVYGSLDSRVCSIAGELGGRYGYCNESCGNPHAEEDNYRWPYGRTVFSGF